MSNIKEHKINKQENMFIKGYYAPDDVINPVIEWTTPLKPQLEGGTTMNSSSGKLEKWDDINNAYKECYEHGIFWPTIREPSILNFLDWCQFALENYIDEYPMLREGGKFKMDPDFNYQKYPKGHAYNGWHCERGSKAVVNRMLVWMMYLNECEDGGETSFLFQKYNMKPERGLLLFWPTDFTHTHRGMPSHKT